MNRKHFIGYLALGAGTIITGLKLTEPKKVVPAKVKEIEKIAIVNWTDEQIREGFRRQFGCEPREIIRVKTVMGDTPEWLAIGGEKNKFENVYWGGHILQTTGDWLSARTRGFDYPNYHQLTDDLKSFINEIS